jgi:predicted RNA polymerase sigma factor
MSGPSAEESPDLGGLVDHLFRRESGKMVSTLTRVFGIQNLDLAEDVVQDALLQALRQWPFAGIPKNPAARLYQVARPPGDRPGAPPGVVLQGRAAACRAMIREHRVAFEVPGAADLGDRRKAVLLVLYLMFNEGYSASFSEQPIRRDVCIEAMRLCKLLTEHPAGHHPTAYATSAPTGPASWNSTTCCWRSNPRRSWP